LPKIGSINQNDAQCPPEETNVKDQWYRTSAHKLKIFIFGKETQTYSSMNIIPK